jgi:hypothetical protein
VRTLILIAGLVLLVAVIGHYDLSGASAFLALGLTMFVVFCLGDVAEQQLIAYFNDEDEQKA